MDSKRPIKFHLCLCAFIVIGLNAQLLHALDIVPFTIKNQSPLVQIYGLPSPGNAVVLPSGGRAFHVRLDHSSNYVEDSNSRERILFDGETTRMTLNGRIGLAENVELGIDIPYINHSGGFLDGFIINYHDLFNFPQGGRDQAPRNRLRYDYVRDGIEKVRVDSSSNGLGDISLMAGYQIYHDGHEFPKAVALRTSLKVPTGSYNELRGSGSTDFSCWLTASNDYKLPMGHGTIFAAAGLMAMTNGDVLPEQQRREIGFGSIGTGWSPFSWIAFKVQFDVHTPFYRESELRVLASNAVQLLMGGTLRLSDRTTLDIAVSEDLVTQTSPDVVFHFDLGIRF